MTVYKYNTDAGTYKLKLTLFKHRLDEPWRVEYAYKFTDPDKREIFSGFDFSTHVSTPEAEAAISLLGFLTLRPGDTDDEYFNGYTPEQIEFYKSDACEELSMYVYDYENKEN